MLQQIWKINNDNKTKIKKIETKILSHGNINKTKIKI